MVLDRLILDDFMTYDHLDYAFEKRPLQVQGLNLTDDRQKTNGTGKSGIPTGIEFCITATNSRGVRDIELITYGKKQARAQLFASCDVRKQQIHIAWVIKAKGANTLELKTCAYGSEEWETVSFSNVNDGKKWIMNWFAISKEDLFNYFIINKTRFKSFFLSSNKEKVDLINRFSDASIIEGLENIETGEMESRFKEAEKLVSEAEGSINTLTAQIIREENRDFKAEMQEDIDDINEEIEDIKSNIESIKEKRGNVQKKVDIKLLEIKGREQDIETAKLDKEDIKADILQMNNNIQTVKEELKAAENAAKEFKTTDWNAERKDFEDDIKADEKTLKTERDCKAKLEDQQQRLAKFLKGLEVKLEGSIICPKCNHEFLLDDDLESLKTKQKQAIKLQPTIDKSLEVVEDKIGSIKQGIKDIEISISNINKKEQKENEAKNELTKAVNSINSKLSELQRKANRLDIELSDCENDITNYYTDIRNLKTDIENIKASKKNFDLEVKNCETEIENYKAQIKGMKLGDSKDRIKELKTELKSAERKKKNLEKDAAKIGDEIYERNQWIANFKQFRMFLANQSLEVIEYHMNRYLHGMGSDMCVKLEGFRIKADGSTKEEITAKIIRTQERTFQSFSGGEQGRLLFAAILANRHMINDSHPYGGLDFLSVDEVFEGMDSLGLKYLIESAKTLGITIMVITHVTDEETDSDTITVIKENNISRIE